MTKEEIFDIFKKILKEKKNSFLELEKKIEIEKIKNKYLKKGGIFSSLFQQITEEKDIKTKIKAREIFNNWKKEFINLLEKKIEEKNEKKQKKIDIYLIGKKNKLGSLHPIKKMIREIKDIFVDLGYRICNGSEIETEKYNFDNLNMPKNHPARKMHDTFYLNDNFLLRTHTSNVQTRIMEKNVNKDLKIISIGKVYRNDKEDATHTHQFTQLEVFSVGKKINFSSLKNTLLLFLGKIFGFEHPIRFRPSYFPFTKPSIEVDAQCISCKGIGCNICKKTGWVEILGAGLIHHKVLENCGFNSEKFTGFAFGLGIERILMIKYSIQDVRNFYFNNLIFLEKIR